MATGEHAKRSRRQRHHERTQSSDRYDIGHDLDSKQRRREAFGSSRRGKRDHGVLDRSRSPLKALKSLQGSPSEQEHSAYVQRWLGQVGGVHENTGKGSRMHSELDGPDSHSKQETISQLQSLHRSCAGHEQQPRKPRKDPGRSERHTSSDSSLLLPVGSSPARRNPSKPILQDAEKKHSKTPHSIRKRKRSLSQSASSDEELPQPDEVFHKRQRHKTKEDRYEPKAQKGRTIVDSKSAKSKSKKAKRGDAAKISRAAGEDLIRSFASNKIARERLTMRPGAGIFKNGKASSPSRNRGISDLAFSEMDFLSHSKNKPAATEKEVITSKHGQKTQRERERTRNEISTYFAPRHASHAVDLHHQMAPHVALRLERDAATVVSSDYGGTSYGQDESPSRRPIPKEQFLGFGTSISSPRKFSLPQASQQPIYVRPSVETERPRSGSSPSYVSWSVTAKSDRSVTGENNPRQLSERYSTDSSSSPSVLRRRLLASGLFEGLGIYRHEFLPRPQQPYAVPAAQEEGLNKEILNTGPRHSSSGAQVSASPLSLQESHPERYQSHPGELRRRQIGAARRAIMSTGREELQEIQDLRVPRTLLASKAYLPLPSSVPRRPATTTSVQRSSQNRVLSRSSLQHEVLQDEPRDALAQPSAMQTQDVHVVEQRPQVFEEQYMDYTSDGCMPNHYDYGDHQRQTQFEESMTPRLEDPISVVDYGDTPPMASEPAYILNEANQLPYDQQSPTAYQVSPEQEYYQEDSRQRFGLCDEMLQYGHPFTEQDPMNQYFQTPRGQSYFQQRSLERPSLQGNPYEASVLDEDQLKGFWAAKRW